MQMVALALQGLHRADVDIIHRDLKPANILIDAHGNAWLADFGLAIARLEQAAVGNPVAGTPPYMSPEQLRGDAVHASTDIWSWGVVLYQLISGRLPFPGNDPAAVLESINRNHRESLLALRDIPVALDHLVNKCLQADEKDRFRSFAEVNAALASLRPSADVSGHRLSQSRQTAGRFSSPIPLLDAGRTSAIVGGTSTWTLAGRPILGRDAEAREVLSEITGGSHPILVLYGSPGAGKTTLGRSVIALLEQDAVNVLRINLSEHDVTFPDLMEQVRSNLNLGLDSGASPGRIQSALIESLSHSGPTVLAVDNFEQVTEDAAQQFFRPLVSFAHVKILVTSRRRFSLTDVEPWQFHVDPLDAPSVLDGQRSDVGELETRFPSVRLFLCHVENAAETNPFTKAVERRDADTIRQIAEICRVLDGYPGPIEAVAKAACRTARLSRLSARIDHYKGRLRHDDPNAFMNIAVRSVFDGLQRDEQNAFLACVQFESGFDESLADGPLSNISPFTDDLLITLEANGLLRRREGFPRTRRQCLNGETDALEFSGYWDVYLPCRECGLELLRDCDDHDERRSSFAEGLLDSCRRAVDEWRFETDEHLKQQQLERISGFRDVFVQAIRILIDTSRAEQAVGLLEPLADSFLSQGPAAELLEIATCIDSCLDGQEQHRSNPGATSVGREHALVNLLACQAARITGDYRASYRHAREATDRSHSSSDLDADFRLSALIALADASANLGMRDDCQWATSEIVTIADAGDFASPDIACKAFIRIAFSIESQEGFQPADDLLQRAETIAIHSSRLVSLEAKWRLVSAKGIVAWREARLDDAVRLHEASLTLALENEMHERYLGGTKTNLVLALVDQGEFEQAQALAIEARRQLQNADPGWLGVNLVAEASALVFKALHDADPGAANVALDFITANEAFVRDTAFGQNIALLLSLKGEAFYLTERYSDAVTTLQEAHEWCRERPGCPSFERWFRVCVYLAELSLRSGNEALQKQAIEYLSGAQEFVRIRNLSGRFWPLARTRRLFDKYADLCHRAGVRP